MIERWYKAPVDCVFDVRIAKMPAGLFVAWHKMQALASLNAGVLPAVGQIAFSLRSSAATIIKRLEALAERGLALLTDGIWRLIDLTAPKAVILEPAPADAPSSDASAPLSGAERTRRWRERQGDAVTGCDDAVTTRDALRKEEIREEKTAGAGGRDARAAVAPPRGVTTQDKPGGVWIAQTSPEWAPWADFFRATKGKSPPIDKRGGWRFPSLAPPQAPLAIAAE